MENIDYIIVGDGFAAVFFAHQLIQNHKSFKLFSDGAKNASQISAGIVNPVVLKKFTAFWKAEEQISFLKKTLNEMESYLGKNFLINEPTRRIFHDEKEKELWLKKSKNDDLRNFLDPHFEKIEGVKNPFQTGKVNFSARLDVENFFAEMLKFLDTHHFLVKEKFDYSDLNSENNTFRNLKFKNIVFCEGMNVKNNPFFSEMPVSPNKGHHLKVKLSEKLSGNETLKKKHFLLPLDENFYYYGGTYDNEKSTEEIDESSKLQLINGLSEMYEKKFEIEEVNYGFRPTVKDRRPILGSHSKYKNFYIFNGLGSRGILNGCYFAKELFEHIENGTPLHPEVDWQRF
jgi:hypothetical protein